MIGSGGLPSCGVWVGSGGLKGAWAGRGGRGLEEVEVVHGVDERATEGAEGRGVGVEEQGVEECGGAGVEGLAGAGGCELAGTKPAL